MSILPCKRWRTSVFTSFACTLCLLVALSLPAFASAAHTNLVQISSDPFTNSTSQHRTEVEPDTYAFGSTIVATFQSGRFFDGGSSDIGWATSKDAGKTWKQAFYLALLCMQEVRMIGLPHQPTVVQAGVRKRNWQVR